MRGNMKWVIVGGQGMLGRDVVGLLTERNYETLVLDRDQIDITDPQVVAQLGAVLSPGDVVVNCAAFTAVDDAESHEDAAFAVNAVGALHVAAAATAAQARLVHVSTDYVFAGDANSPYGENAPTVPVSAYGRTKLAGEWAARLHAPNALIVRTAWLYGAGGNCFPKTMARLLRERESVAVVTDQVGQPTWSFDVARIIVDLVTSGAAAGNYHATAAGSVSWHGFTVAIATAMGIDPARVTTTTASAFSRPAPRPPYSVLGHDAFTGTKVQPIADWRQRWQVAAPVVLGL